MTRPSAIEVLRARAQARAQLWFNGALDLHDAIDELWGSAVCDGLVAELGPTAVQKVIADAFAPLRTDLPWHDAPRPAGFQGPRNTSGDDQYEGLSSSFAEACRKADEKQAGKPIDPRIARLRRLIDANISLEQLWDELNSSQEVPEATLRAAEYLIQQKDPERLRAWLKKRPASERKAILAHLERRGGKK